MRDDRRLTLVSRTYRKLPKRRFLAVSW
jgi:hypothetical protein